MNSPIWSLVPLAVVATLQPSQVIACLVLLPTRRGVENVPAYLAGMNVFRLVLGEVFWVLVSSVEETIESRWSIQYPRWERARNFGLVDAGLRLASDVFRI